MRITILTVGTRGDVQPYLALGRGLQAAGHTVCLAAGPEHETVARGAGLLFAPVRSRFARRAAGDGAGPDGPYFQQLRDCWAAAQGSNVVLSGVTGLRSGQAVAEKLCVPFLPSAVLPLTPTRAFPHPVFPPPPLLAHNGLYNLLTYTVFLRAGWYRISKPLNRARSAVLDLPPLTSQTWTLHDRPTLYGYSPSVLPKPADWDDQQHVTGYWFDRPAAGWSPPAELLAFLEAGPPPVHVTFGSRSVAGLSPAALLACVQRALRRTGQRAIVALDPREVENIAPDELYLDPHTPHAWLFPRVAAVVHHGGAGSTAATLRAGLPAVIVPAGYDQPFWAWRAEELGVGVRGPRWGDAEKLSVALSRVLRDGGMRARAAALGERIRAEDGVGQAVAVIERSVGG